MGDPCTEILLYGAARCHKTLYYMEFMDNRNIQYMFRDVERHEVYAQEVRALYRNGKLNFPTIRVGEKRLRNPSDKELLKWLAPNLPNTNTNTSAMP